MRKTERIEIRLTQELKEKIQATAESENRTITNYIENIIAQALQPKKDTNNEN